MVSEDFSTMTINQRTAGALGKAVVTVGLFVSVVFGSFMSAPAHAASVYSSASSSPVPASVSAAQAKYNAALSAYKAAASAYVSVKASTGTSPKARQAAFQAAKAAYQKASQARTTVVRAISAAYSKSITIANANAKSGLKKARTAEGKNQVRALQAAAIIAATSNRESELGDLEDLGSAPSQDNWTPSPSPSSSEDGQDSND